MRIVASYRGHEREWETREPEVVFGRADEKSPTRLDLAPDQTVSRAHGRIWEEGGLYWIEDLDSRCGTRLNGTEIKGKGRHQLRIGDLVLAGSTTLRVESSRQLGAPNKTQYLEEGTVILPDTSDAETQVAIAKDVSATLVTAVPAEVVGEEAARRLRLICAVPLQLAGKTSREALLRLIVERLGEVLPSCTSVGLVLRDPHSDALLLKA
jgi:predicted component of type VI protein secretion system